MTVRTQRTPTSKADAHSDSSMASAFSMAADNIIALSTPAMRVMR